MVKVLYKEGMNATELMPVPFSPNLVNEASDDENCLLCGKPILGHITYVEMTTDLFLVPNGVEVPNSQGCFPVDERCIRKVPPWYRQ